SLVLCLVLVDVTIPPQELDQQLLDWLRHVDRNFLLVATKADRISGNQLRSSLHRLTEQLQVDAGRIMPFSAKSRTGYNELWAAIRRASGVDEPENSERAG